MFLKYAKFTPLFIYLFIFKLFRLVTVNLDNREIQMNKDFLAIPKSYSKKNDEKKREYQDAR